MGHEVSSFRAKTAGKQASADTFNGWHYEAIRHLLSSHHHGVKIKENTALTVAGTFVLLKRILTSFEATNFKELFSSPPVCKQSVDLGGVSLSLTAQLKTPYIIASSVSVFLFSW